MSMTQAEVDILADEQTNDPITRGYSAMSDQEYADSLNAVDRTVRLKIMPGAQIFAETDAAELESLSAVERAEWISYCAIVDHNVDDDSPVVVAGLRIFPGSSNTLSNLAAARDQLVSRAAELGLPIVSVSHISRIP